MNITIVCKSVLPALKYGGTERVVWYLGKELHKMGHKVTFLAMPGSACPFAEVVPIDATKPLAAQIPADTEVVHLNDFVPEGLEKPYIVTIHGNLSPNASIDPNAVFVSSNHARRYGCDSFVYNGLDWDDYPKADLKGPRRGYHFLGKAAWRVKNLKGAMQVARGVRPVHLDVLGGYRFNVKMGVRLTFDPRIKFHGMVDDAVKRRIIEHSGGLLFPVRWHEPFGLAVIESLYYGAPVFGTPYGSLPELVVPDCGYLTNRAQDMIEHLRPYAPDKCHDYARTCFNSRIMAESYIHKYEKVLNGGRLIDHFEKPLSETYPLPWS
ncbi:MAG: glycosyltransferase [Bacteroidales bacterium]|nr:glycosyltransferase [Bacteroidales bacterium]